MTVGQALERERPSLLPLPGDAFCAEDVIAVRVGKTPYVRFDLNDYSVPHTCVRRQLVLRATPDRVRILDADVVIAVHRRCYDRGRPIEDQAHLAALVAHKREARAHRGIDRLHHTVPRSAALFTLAAHNGQPLGALTSALLRMLDEYGASELAVAIDEALARGVPHPHALRQCLERRRQDRAAPPPLPLRLPEKLAHLVVKPHPLASYDGLGKGGHDDRDEQ